MLDCDESLLGCDTMNSCYSNLKMCENHLRVLRFLSLTLRDCDLAVLKGGPGTFISNKHPEDTADCPPAPGLSLSSIFSRYFRLAPTLKFVSTAASSLRLYMDSVNV